MKPLLILIVTLFISLLILFITNGEYDWQRAGRISMGTMLLFTAIAHFKFSKGMMMMVPNILPFKKAIVYLSGIVEIILAICMLLSINRIPVAWITIALFLVLLPANINATIKHVDYENGDYKGNGISYLWFRVPLQMFFIAWVYFSTIFT